MQTNGTVTPGQRWRAARLAAGLSADDAAQLAECSRNTIYDLEKDDQGVTLRIMLRVAAAIGTTIGEIFCDHTDQQERVPSELRPLLEPLMPFTKQQREQIVRNIAANMSFQQMMYGVVPQPATLKDGSISVQNHKQPSSMEWRNGSITNGMSNTHAGNPDVESATQNQDLTSFLSGERPEAARASHAKNRTEVPRAAKKR